MSSVYSIKYEVYIPSVIHHLKIAHKEFFDLRISGIYLLLVVWWVIETVLWKFQLDIGE
jgi:hypothetical protein